ncbi:ankyrin repeat domain-containing protein 13C [Sarcoptes scabiei]|nr:ankyrin repeat domain-containing protein 13C [Sarcoptes scabiei]
MFSESLISTETKKNLIEGLDDDVLFVFIAFSTISIVFIYYVWQRVNLPALLIHRPSNDANVIDNEFNNSSNSRNRHFNTMDGNCPVCLNSFTYPIETNCGHMFCAECILRCWQQPQWRGGPIKCPVCRQQVNILLPCFNVNSVTNVERVDANQSSISDSNSIANNRPVSNQFIRELNRYNRRFSGEPRPWYDYLYDLPTMLRHLSNDFFSFSGLFYMFRIRVIICFLAAIMYLISPLDMIPEAVFGIFGLFDDILVVLLLAIYVTIIYRRFLSSRWGDD